jgi:hypothetical protein
MGMQIRCNALKDNAQVENILFAKLLSVNFEFSECNFTEANMKAKDRAGKEAVG